MAVANRDRLSFLKLSNQGVSVEWIPEIAKDTKFLSLTGSAEAVRALVIRTFWSGEGRLLLTLVIENSSWQLLDIELEEKTISQVCSLVMMLVHSHPHQVDISSLDDARYCGFVSSQPVCVTSGAAFGASREQGETISLFAVSHRHVRALVRPRVLYDLRLLRSWNIDLRYRLLVAEFVLNPQLGSISLS